MPDNKNSTIVVVEDADADFAAMSRAFAKVGLTNPVRRCADGTEALNYLMNGGPTATSASAGLVLLDLNLPGVDGREVLRRLKEDKATARLPVIVMTTSDDERDVDDCYRLGANSYVVKPVSFDGFVAAMRGLKEFWLDASILPRVARAVTDNVVPLTAAART